MGGASVELLRYWRMIRCYGAKWTRRPQITFHTPQQKVFFVHVTFVCMLLLHQIMQDIQTVGTQVLVFCCSLKTPFKSNSVDNNNNNNLCHFCSLLSTEYCLSQNHNMGICETFHLFCIVDFASVFCYQYCVLCLCFWYTQTALLALDQEDIPGAPIAMCVLACPAFHGWNEC